MYSTFSWIRSRVYSVDLDWCVKFLLFFLTAWFYRPLLIHCKHSTRYKHNQVWLRWTSLLWLLSILCLCPLFVPSHLFLITWGLSSHWLNACSIQWEGFSSFLIQTLEALFVVVVWVYSTQSATATATYDLSQSSNSVDIVTFAINNLRGLKWLWFWIAFRSSQVDCSSSVSAVWPNQGS